MKWKSEFMRGATGSFGVYADAELKKRITYYLECLDDLIDAIEAHAVIDRSWPLIHSQ